MNGPAQLLGQLPRALCGGVAQHHEELFAAVAPHDILRANTAADHVHHTAQYLIAGQMAMRVVDVLEEVNVHHHHGQRLPRADGPAHIAVQCGDDGAAVGYARQFVQGCQAAVGLVGTLFGHEDEA